MPEDAKEAIGHGTFDHNLWPGCNSQAGSNSYNDLGEPNPNAFSVSKIRQGIFGRLLILNVKLGLQKCVLKIDQSLLMRR
jgi:hypothetical protein